LLPGASVKQLQHRGQQMLVPNLSSGACIFRPQNTHSARKDIAGLPVAGDDHAPNPLDVARGEIRRGKVAFFLERGDKIIAWTAAC
jgi:hypothetical protein